MVRCDSGVEYPATGRQLFHMVKRFMEDPHRALILGAGEGGTAVLEMLNDEELVDVVGIADVNPRAPGMRLARAVGVPVFTDIGEALKACAPCVAFNLTGNEMVDDVVAEALGVGAVIGGMEARLIVRMISKIKATKEQLRFEATHDHLTGAYNRRHIMEVLERGMAQAVRYGFPYSVVLIDLDHFKQVNDTHGHAAGDAVLKAVVEGLRNGMREADTLGRWGGEEFIVLLPHTAGQDAQSAAGKWLDDVSSRSVELPEGRRIPVSFSAGVACFDGASEGSNLPVGEHIERLLRQADERLYAAKRSGRSMVCGASSEA